jgi:sulfate adenylyltransferase
MNITQNQVLLLYNIFSGNLKPVNKLINKYELLEILENYTFNQEVYSLPYLFFIDNLVLKNQILELTYEDNFVCKLEVQETYEIDFDFVSTKIFGTNNILHPGVKDLYSNKDKICLGGYIKEFNNDILELLNIPYIKTPKVCEYVFQSRNPPHIAHESIVKKYAPNLLYTTPFSTIKSGDYSFDQKIKTYETMKELYGIDIFVSTLPRLFAGPREALQNMILFKNLGAKYFVFGRGKNCVGNFYGDMESYEFCKTFESKLGIVVLFQNTILVEGNEVKGSEIKKNYIDKNILPPKKLMNPKISRILLCKEN